MSAVQIFPSGDVREAPDPDDLIEHGPYELLVWARKQKTGHSTRKLVLKSLVERANSHGVTWVGQDALAEDCEVDVSTIRRVLRELEDQGLIGRFKRYEAVGGRKFRTSDVTIIGPSLPEQYRSKCTVGLTRENANEDLPGTGTTEHGCAVDLTCGDAVGEVLPLTGATKHPCLDLPCTGAQSVPCMGARGITMVEEPVLEVTPFVDPASGDDRGDAANAERLFPTTDLPGKQAKKRVPVNHDGETLWFDTEADAVFGLWARLHGKQSTTVFSDGRKEKVGASLRKVGLARCLDAVRGNALSEWHQGDNEDGRKYHDLVNIFRNATTRDQAEMYWNEPEKRRNGYSRFARTGRGQRGSLAAPLPTAADFGDDEDAEKDQLRRAYRTGCDEARRARPDAGEAAWQEHGKAKARELREKLRAGV